MGTDLPFAAHRGAAYLDLIDPVQRKGLYGWQEVLRLGCGDLVDGNYFINNQIYLCAETADYIYSDFTPTTVNYERGSRPVLDKIVDAMGVTDLPDFSKFLWLGRFVRDLPNARAWDLGREAQDGGTEEDLIQKRVSVCNEQARLMIILCQVAGLPARYVGHHIGGHGVTEICIDGRWAYYDIRGRFFFLNPEDDAVQRGEPGRMASTWEVWQDTGLIRRQPPWVMREIHPRYATGDGYRMTEANYFHPKECTGVVNYFVADHDTFNYARDWPMSDEDKRRAKELADERNEARRALGMIAGY